MPYNLFQDLKFHGLRPYWQRSIQGDALARIKNKWAAFFYVAVQKKGYVNGYATHEAFRDYSVQVQWILNLYQAEKLTADHAKRLLINIPGRAQHAVAEVEFCEQARVRNSVADMRKEAERVLTAALRPFRTFPLIEEWRLQYSQVLHRYKFLILEGPSRTGKTQLARSLCPVSQRVFEVNCAADSEPPLQGFDPIQFGLILLDEIRPATVVRQRKLFQASLAEIQLGCSVTNVYMYKVCTYRTRMVCCSNDWTDHLRELDASSREWIAHNSFHVPVVEQCWMEEVVDS